MLSEMGDKKKSNCDEDNQIDILSIDTKIKDMFQIEKDNLARYKQQLSDLEKAVNSPKLSHKTFKNLQESINVLKDKIYNIENEIDVQFYISESYPIISEYDKKIKIPVKISFMGKKQKEDKCNYELILKYIKIACKYIELSTSSKPKSQKIVCPDCGNKKDFEFDDGIYSCTICGREQDTIMYMTSYKDIDRVNISTKYMYDRMIHFRDAINQYQGKQNCTIEPKIYEDLEEEFNSHQLLIGNKDTPNKIRFSKIKKSHIYDFLKELGRSKHTTSEKQFYTKHYENVNLIHYKFTEIPPDNISHLEDDLMNDFSRLSDLYDQMYKQNNEKKTDRKNFLNTQHILYQLLCNRNHPCKKEDFNMLKTGDRKSFHDDICETLFAKLDMRYFPFL